MSYFLSISCDFPVISIVGLLGKLGAYCILISAVWLRNRPGFAALYGIHMASFFGIMFPSVIVILHVFYVVHHLSLLHLN